MCGNKFLNSLRITLLRLGLVCCIVSAWPAAAQTENAPAAMPDGAVAQQLEARRQAIRQEQANVARERADLDALRREISRQMKALDIGQIERVLVEQAELNADAERVNVSGVEVELRSAEKQMANLNAAIETIQRRLAELNNLPVTGDIAEERAALQQELALQQSFLELESQHLANLQAARYIASQRLDLAQRWAQELRTQYKTARELNDKAALGNLQTRIQKEQQELLNRAAELRKRLEAVQGTGADAQAERNALRARLQEAEELGKMKQIELALVQAQVNLNAAEAVLNNDAATSAELGAAVAQADNLVRELAARADFVQRKKALLKEQLGVVVKRLTEPAAPADRTQAVQDSRTLEKLLDTLDKQAKQFAFLTEKVRDRHAALQTRHQQALREGLLVRQAFPTELAGWRSMGAELLALPALLWHTTFTPMSAAVRQSGTLGLTVGLAAELAWLGFIAWLYRYLTQALARLPASPVSKGSFLVSVVQLTARLLCANIFSIAVIGALLIAFSLAGMPQPGFNVLIILAWGWLAYKAAVDLARLLLLDAHFARGGRHPRLYRALSWGILAVSLFTSLMLIGHVVPISTALRDLIDRAFMLLLVPALVVILRGRSLLLSPLAATLSTRWLQVAERTVVTVATAMLASVSVGVLGYINLAWTIARYVGLFLLVLAGWLLLRGLLRDLVKGVKNRVAPATYGQPGTHSFIENMMDPLGRVAQFVLFVAAFVVLFRLYGWGAESSVVHGLRTALFNPLLEIGGRPISLFNILLTLLIIVAVMRVGRWSRELTYRWLFYKVPNNGTRHSLSVFSQYLVVLVGFLIALRVLGLDLTTLTVFAGALGVGIGFGLQNVANNFVSGILLLIERPVRTGDTVTIGNSEGSVTRIGIRSLTIKTPDHQEVIIPNSEVISHPFTNWTFTDTVVRTTFTVGIAYQNDVHLAQHIIEQILQQHPAILKTTPANVWLEEFTPPTVVFRVQYFTDLCSYNRQEVKSALLFQIWDRFKQDGVRFPGDPPPVIAPSTHDPEKIKTN